MSIMPGCLLLTFALTTISCRRTADERERPTEAGTAAADSTRADSLPKDGPDKMEAEQRYFEKQRLRMVDQQLKPRDITNPRVLQAMSRVPRHLFVPADVRDLSYSDSPLAIGHGQTISQPLIVALMTQLADPQLTEKALDIGTGSGYQAAVLAELVGSVYSIEIVEPLARQARDRLRKLGYQNVQVRHGDGYRGWPVQAPFDIILVAAAPDHVPQELIKQLAPGGKMVIPVGEYFQNLLLIEKDADGSVTEKTIAPVAFVPMTGEAEDN
jgi:protein-L-isoaspartate(D-aspartate) O-methyltransferase